MPGKLGTFLTPQLPIHAIEISDRDIAWCSKVLDFVIPRQLECTYILDILCGFQLKLTAVAYGCDHLNLVVNVYINGVIFHIQNIA